MGEAITKSVKVTFHEGGLPGGTFATFKVGKELYVAWPMPKHRAAQAVIDRLIGALSRVRGQAIGFINAYPQDAARIAKLLEIARDADAVAAEATLAKSEVWRS